MIEKKGSLIDAVLKAAPGEFIPVEYKDVPLGKLILLPSNITGSEIQRSGGLIVVAVQVDRDIVAYLYVQKGSQLIQIRPIPRQKTPTKEGEINTIEYNRWVERIKREAPEYLPEWEKKPGMYPTPGVSTTPKIFTYYFRNRPPDIGTFPKGAVMKEAWIPKRSTEKGNMAWGWVSYERELTPDELYNYELFVDETVMPKLVKELIKFTYDEGINEGFKELKSEYGKALIEWLKANNEWKPDKGEEAEFLRHLARLTGVTNKKVQVISADELKETQFFKDQLPYLLHNLDKGYQQRVNTFVSDFNKEFAPSKKVITKYIVEQAVTNEKKAMEVTKPTEKDIEMAKLFLSALSRFTLDELIQQEASVRRWSIKFPQMEKELEDEYKMYLELRQAEKATTEAARKEKASKPQSEQAKELYKQMRKTNSVQELDNWRNAILFETSMPDVEEWILLRDLAEEWRTYLETRGVPASVALTKLPIEYTNEDYYFGTEVWVHPTTTIFDDQPLKGKLHQALNGGELFEVAIEGREGTQRIQIDRIYVTKVIEKPPPKDKFAEIQDQMQRDRDIIRASGQLESAESLYKRYTSGYSSLSLFGIVRQDPKDLAHSIGFELKLNTAIYTPLILLQYAEKFKEFAQRDYEKEHQRQLERTAKEQTEKETERQQGGQAFWDEVKNLKVVDFEIQHDINPDKPSRDYYHVYDRTFAILENGKKVQISYVIYKGEEGKRAAKATKEYYMRIYGQYMGKPLSEWITYDQLMTGNRYEDYKAQQPKTRFTFIPEAPAPVSITQPAPKIQSTQELTQQLLNSIQAARSVEELQPILKGIGFMPLPETEKRQVMDVYQTRYSTLAGQRPFGERLPVEEKPKFIGAPSRQEIAEAELRRKAEEGKKLRGQVELGGAVSTATRLGLFEPGAMEKAKAEAEARRRIEALGLPSTTHPVIKRLAESPQAILKFGNKRGSESLEDIVLRRYVQYCPPGTIIDNRNVPKVTERWWVYPPKLRTCITQVNYLTLKL